MIFCIHFGKRFVKTFCEIKCQFRTKKGCLMELPREQDKTNMNHGGGKKRIVIDIDEAIKLRSQGMAIRKIAETLGNISYWALRERIAEAEGGR